MKSIIAVLVVLVVVSVVNAEPSGGVKYLMNEPLTLFDFGLYRLEKDLENERKRINQTYKIEGEGFSFVSYDWDDNKILIKISLQLGENDKRDIVDLLKNVIEGYELRYYNVLPSFFQHIGFNNKFEPKDLKSELRRISEFTVYTNKIGSLTKFIECKSTLALEQVFCSEFPPDKRSE